MKIKFCPKCGKGEIMLVMGGSFGTLYECKNCGFQGAIFPEKELKLIKKKDKK
jgi:DNA-directed RNA polymerase subunit M/transcription elongation factor TFIIS